MPKRLTENTPLSEAGTTTSSGRMRVVAISAGLGSSGYYSPDVIKEAADKKLIARGTPLYFDHPSESDRHERPGRSVRDIAAVFLDEASYDVKEQALVGDIQVFSPYRDLLTEMGPHIGLSIHGSATDVTEGEIEGRRVPIIEGLAAIDSVDFVTKAGRGGKVVALLESAEREQELLEATTSVVEATASDRMDHLRSVVRDTHRGMGRAWVRDHDAEATTVWFDVHPSDDTPSKTFQQTYTVGANDVDVTLTGDPVEVKPVTKYVPVTRPDSTTPTTEADQEVTMGNIQIEESEHKALVEKAGRVDTLESERDTQKSRADVAEAALAGERRRNRAMDLIREHEHPFTPLEAKGLVADLPLTESGDFDETAFGTQLAEHAAAAAKARGAGTVTGFGQTTDTSKTTTESAPPAKTAWGRPLTEQKGA